MANKFQKNFAASVKGEEATAKAERNFLRAKAFLESQIAVMKGEQVQKELNVAQAKQALTVAQINNGKELDSRENYLNSLVTAFNNVTKAEEALADHKTHLEFFESQLAAISESES